MEKMMVSIYCLAYNHEPYIAKALEGFVNQKCSFPFEVIVHDDASTDKTANIIHKYQKLYPHIIKPIYQKTNLYSKGVEITKEYILPKATGKYIAVCEGDDYWIDPFKLQKQVDYMEAHPDCTFCFTNGYIEDLSNGGKRRPFIPFSEKDRETYIDKSRKYTLHDIHELSFVPTASYLYPKTAILKVQSYWTEKCPIGDLRMRLYLMSLGYAYYINEKTCVYRQNVPNSAMTRWKSDGRKAAHIRESQVVAMIRKLDMITNAEYRDGLDIIKSDHVRGMLNSATSFTVFKDDECRKLFKKISLKEKVRVIAKMMLPENLLVFLKKMV